jgi:nicotinamidase/pyrazinamidase
MTAYPRGTALVVVDVQNDFADPQGSLSVRGGLHVVRRPTGGGGGHGRRGIRCTTAGLAPADTPALRQGRRDLAGHCVQGTWGAQLHPA